MPTKCILELGIGYLAVCAYKGSFFKVNTASGEQLDNLLGTLNLEMPKM